MSTAARSLLHRIEALEQGNAPASDEEMLAFGRTVTDEELQALIVETERYLMEHGQPGTTPGPVSKADFWRLARPFIEELRAV